MNEKLELLNPTDNTLLLAFVTQAESASADNILVNFVTAKMHERLKIQRDRGFKGWNTARCNNSDLKKRLLEKVECGRWIDVINLAAMIFVRTLLFIEVPLKSDN